MGQEGMEKGFFIASAVEDLKLPENFLSSYLKGFVSLLQTGISCESAIFFYMLSIYDEQPVITNDNYFREQFRSFCEKHGGKPFVDSTIKKALKNLTKLNLILKPEYGQYRLHSRFFILE